MHGDRRKYPAVSKSYIQGENHMEMKKRGLLRWEKDFTMQILRLAVPVMIQSMVMALMHIVDNLMVGRLGATELAAVTQANRITFLFQLAMFGASGGVSVFTAQFWGKKDLCGVRSVQGIGLIAGLIVAAIIGVPSIVAPQAVLSLLLKNEEAIRIGADYLRIMGCLYFVQSITLIESTVLKSTEQAKLPMIAGIVAIVTNTVLNYLLIFDHGSFGGYGVVGAATATLIGGLLELAIILTVSYKRGYANAAKLHELKIESFAFVKRYFGVALPIVLNEGLWALGVVMYSVVYGRIGDGVNAVAAMSIFNNIEQLACIVQKGLMTAFAVMIGMAIGAGDKEEAKFRAKRFLLMAPIAAQAFALLLIPFINPIIGFFNVDAAVADSARRLTYIFLCFVWSHAYNSCVIVSVLRAGGDVTWAAVVDVGTVWLMGVPAVAIAGLVFKWDIELVYLMTYTEQAFKLIIGGLRVRSGKWVVDLVN